MSGSAYTARARATRCFWPPERLMPRSPIMVWSPCGSTCMSARRAQASSTASYRFSSQVWVPPVMLSRSEAFRTQATCAQ
mmetsp:Transcript_61307/g.179801  ORF Transcript_61307/g.179801 Transcript_61307/m.179801 type:complete len:80 (-) Transcript_61307:1717-1956(-)